MKLEHLIKGYKAKNIDVELKENNNPVAILKFTDNILCDCYQFEDIVTSIQLITDVKAKDQMQHCIHIIKVISTTIDLQTNLNEEERNTVMNALGIYDGTFIYGKDYTTSTHIFKIYIMSGVLIMSISEIENGNNIPPCESIN